MATLPERQDGRVRITARVDYAVRAALELAAVAPDALTSERIATAQGIPSRFLQAILGDLQHARLVTSHAAATAATGWPCRRRRSRSPA